MDQRQQFFLTAIADPSKGNIDIKDLPPDFIYQLQENLARLETFGDKYDINHTSLKHTFVDGLYLREITMQKGRIVISHKHKTTHPYIISKGVVTVFIPEEGLVVLKAPFQGITKAGTKRLLFINEETVWTTIHKTDLTDPDKIVMEITEPERLLQ